MFSNFYINIINNFNKISIFHFHAYLYGIACKSSNGLFIIIKHLKNVIVIFTHTQIIFEIYYYNMMRSHHDSNTLDKKLSNENKQTFSRLFKKNKKGYLFIKFIHPINRSEER